MRITRRAGAAAILLATTACASPDETSGELHLDVVQAPTTFTPGDGVHRLIARVVNGDGTGIAGVPVTWSITSGGGAVSADADTSGLDGLSAARWAPGLAATQQVAVSIYDQPALMITVTSTSIFRAQKLAGMNEHACGLLDGAVWCWNDDYPVQPIRRILPQFQAGDLAASYAFACILDSSGIAHCNRAFENMDPTASFTIPGLPPLKYIAAGGRYFCGIALADGTPWCWTDNGASPANQPSTSLTLTGISAGSYGACGIDGDGAAWCWSPTVGGVPAPVPGGHVFRQVSVEPTGLSKCGIVAPDQVYCWDSDTSSPTRMTGISAGQVALGYPFSLFNTSPIVVPANMSYNWSADGMSYSLGLSLYGFYSFPLPVRQVYDGCVLSYDNSAYCISSKPFVESIPAPLAWKGIPLPE